MSGWTARRLALRVLLEVADEQAYTNVALQRAYRDVHLDDRERGLCTEIVYGTIQRQRSLDLLLEPLLSRPLAELDSLVLSILRMTAYQIGYLDKIPGYAAVHEAVELCKRTRPRAAGFVNGVLRAWLRDERPVADRLRIRTETAASWADAAGLEHSYPTWMVERWERQFGRDRTLRLLIACNQPSALSVRVNRRAATVAEVLQEIETQGGEAATSAVWPDGLRFSQSLGVEHWSAYREGRVTVQDEAAMLVAPLLQPADHRTILDMCAAPGTKTTHVAELQGDGGSIDACDIHMHKLEHLHAATQRLGLNSIHPMLADARSLPLRAELAGHYDAVLLDAPCSGLGVLRHRPDIRWRRTPDDVISLRTLQLELLRAALELVRPGGLIVYATCTLLTEENEDVVDTVLGQTGVKAIRDDIRSDLPDSLQPLVSAAGDLLLAPDEFGTDGFYMARLRKV